MTINDHHDSTISVGRVSLWSLLGAALICLGISSLALYELRGVTVDSEEETSVLETTETTDRSDVATGK